MEAAAAKQASKREMQRGKGIFEAIMSKVVYTEEPSYTVDVDMSWVAIRRTKLYDRRDDRIIIADDNTIEGL